MPRFRIPQRVVLIDSFVSVPKIGVIKAIVHRPLEGVTKGATFKRDACGHWYVSLVVEQQIAPRTDRPVATHVGIDVGVKSLAVLSTGETIDNPRWYRTQARKLRRAQGTQPHGQRQSQPRQGAACGSAAAPEDP
jgi:putative transposase